MSDAAGTGPGLARALIADAIVALDRAAARDEAIGEYLHPRPVLGVKRDPVIRSFGSRVWRVGVLLLGRDGRVWSTGTITRVTEPGRSQYQSVAAERRRAYRAAAARGRFAAGDTVNHGVEPILLDDTLVGGTGVLFVREDVPLVRWAPTVGDDAAVPLATYLDDRVPLLLDPPEGATAAPTQDNSDRSGLGDT